jgi:phage terminase small subunit
LPVLADPKREKFAQYCSRGFTTIDAYARAGYKRNTGNATAFRKRPEIIKRIEEIQKQKAQENEEDLSAFLEESGLTQTYIIKQLLDTANEAKEGGKYDIAAKCFKDIGSELFGMFTERKHLTVDQNSVHTETKTTLNFSDINSALEGLANASAGLAQIDGVSQPVDLGRTQLAPLVIEHDGE